MVSLHGLRGFWVQGLGFRGWRPGLHAVESEKDLG